MMVDYPPQSQPVTLGDNPLVIQRVVEPIPTTIQGVVPTSQGYYQSSAVAKTSTNVVLVSVKIAEANPNRKGFIIFNNSANSVYVSLTGPAVAATCTRLIATYAAWEWLYPIAYTGEIYAIRNSGTGQVTVWEFT